MSARRRIVVIGAGQCAASAVSALRSNGSDDEIVVVGAEADLPYERPPLSKDLLLGKVRFDDLLIRPEAWFADNDVTLRLGATVERLDPGARTVEVSDGGTLRYDAVLIATGGRARRLPCGESDRIVSLRDRADAEQLAAHLAAGQDLTILGGGFIGCEVAAAAREAGCEVTVLEMQDHPLQAVLGSRVGRVVSELHRDAGVHLRTGERVRSVTDEGDRVTVVTDRGTFTTALLLVAIGLEANTDFLAGSGVACENGVVVDEFCRTSVEGVFAAGDVASHYHPTFDCRVRVEHYDNAIKQGAAAAANLMGRATAFDDPHWFWSDQHGHNLQSVGVVQGYDELVIRGEPAELSFSVFYLRDGAVRSVFGLNRPKDVSIGRRMVSRRYAADPNQLRDTSIDLRRLLAPARQEA